MRRKVFTRTNLCGALWGGLAVLISLAVACGGGSEQPPTVDVELYGWANDQFVDDLTAYPEADWVSVKLTHPNRRRIVSSSNHEIGSQQAEIPKLSFGEGLRLDFDLVDADGGRVASGATPSFELRPGGGDRSFEAMIMPVRSFAPVGARYRVGDGEFELQETSFDTRSVEGQDLYLGRAGHAAAKTSRDNVIIVGGGHPDPRAPHAKPSLKNALGDVQLFETGNGYTTDLSYNQEERKPRENGADRLDVPRAYHTLTPVGDDRFIVAGGYRVNDAGETEVTSSIEMIDMRAEPGKRVSTISDEDGNPIELNVARAFHTATYRRRDNHVVVAGGVGGDGADNILKTVELIDLDEGAVKSLATTMQQPRAQHEAIKMGNDAESIWMFGGRHPMQGALRTTEMLFPQKDSLDTVAKQDMEVPRYELGATRIRSNVVAVCGGFTSSEASEGEPSVNCQIGRSDGDSWSSTWTLARERGGLDMVGLTQSRDLVVLGGRDSDGETVATPERLEFQDKQQPPYRAELQESSMHKTRYGATVTSLSSGLILLTGGLGTVDNQPATLNALEYYNPGDIVRALQVESSDNSN